MRGNIAILVVRAAAVALVAATFASATAATAQVLQLPSFNSFGTDTTVLVPDGGTAVLGGNAAARSGVNQFGGLPPQRSLGSERQSSRASVTAKVHDLNAMDEALQKTPSPARGSASSAARAKFTDRSPADAALPGVAEIRRQRAARLHDDRSQARQLLTKAQVAQAAGKDRVARMYREQAVRKVTQPSDAQRAPSAASHPASRSGSMASSRATLKQP